MKKRPIGGLFLVSILAVAFFTIKALQSSNEAKDDSNVSDFESDLQQELDTHLDGFEEY